MPVSTYLMIFKKKSKKNFPTWYIFVLLKWILLYSKNADSERDTTISEVLETLKLIEQFESDAQLLSFKSRKEIKRSLRILAYQQFWLQDIIQNNVFDRQIQLFKIQNSNGNIDNEFRSLTGLTIIQFLNICYSIFLYYQVKNTKSDFGFNGIIEQDYFDFIKFPDEDVEGFISLLTLKQSDEIVKLQKLLDEARQLYETNFLLTKPFMVFDRTVKIIHESIFNQTCKYFVYDFLKPLSKTFSSDLGRSMEKYIRLGLDAVNLKYKIDTQLKSLYPHVTKITDFLIDECVLLESKAIELDPYSAINRDNKTLSRNLKKSFVKAYCQMLSTASAINPRGIFYGLVITYKETYIGFGFDAWDEFLKEEIENFVAEKCISLSMLPPENICFIDLETWDYIIQAIQIHKCTIQEIIEKSKESNKDALKGKMMMEQVLNNHFSIERFELSYLNDAHKFINVFS
jgi:hypothetical protein